MMHIESMKNTPSLCDCLLRLYFAGADVSSTMCLFRAGRSLLARFESGPLLEETRVLTARVPGRGSLGRVGSSKEQGGGSSLGLRMLGGLSEDLAGELNRELLVFVVCCA